MLQAESNRCSENLEKKALGRFTNSIEQALTTQKNKLFRFLKDTEFIA